MSMTQSTTRGDGLTPAERRAIDEQVYWETSLHLVEESSASVISGLELPVVGGMVAHALDHAIGTTIAMMQHPDEDLRWTADVAHVLRGRILSVVRLTPGGVDAISFDTGPLVLAERVVPGRRASRSSSIVFIDGSLESPCYGLGIPLSGRDLAVVLDDVVRSTCDAMKHPDPAIDRLDDVAFSFRGRFVAVIRYTPERPIVTRFDLPDSSSGRPADPRDRPGRPMLPADAGGQDLTSPSAAGLSPMFSS
jgi:hypothetical protein